ncbi:hypothetical protein PLICRDRAFT_190867 [Plicaturopsis crispa FD-325 SS-3]|nr:hypothetical protein PLICRDRAFT_190867 [Plicaturopsis crispa FD-325 SS-3]
MECCAFFECCAIFAGCFGICSNVALTAGGPTPGCFRCCGGCECCRDDSGDELDQQMRGMTDAELDAHIAEGNLMREQGDGTTIVQGAQPVETKQMKPWSES